MRRRGFTVLEILVSATLLLLLLGILKQGLTSGLRVWTHGRQRAEAQQAALVVSARISKDFHGAHPESAWATHDEVTIDGRVIRRDGVSFLTCFDEHGEPAFDEGGGPLWQRRIVIYHSGDSNEVRVQEIALEPPTSDPDPLVLEGISPDPHDRVIARGVRALCIDDTSLPLLRFRVEATSGDAVSVIDTTSLPVLATGASPQGGSRSPSPGEAPPRPGP